MKALQRLWRKQWRRLGLAAVLIGCGSGLFLYRLGSLGDGLWPEEQQALARSADWHSVASNTLYLPLHVLQWLCATYLSHQGHTLSRLPSVLFGIVSIICMAYLFRRWYGIRTAVYATAALACSSFLLHLSRFAGDGILYFSALPALWAARTYFDDHHTTLSVFAALAVGALALYIPGMVWIVVLLICLRPLLLVDGWERLRSPLQRAAAIALPLLLLMPLVLTFVRTPAVWRLWLGLPPQFLQPHAMLQRAADVSSFLVIHGPADSSLWLNRLPLLDILAITMLLFGIVFYLRHFKAERSRMLLSVAIVGTALYALGGAVDFSFLVPIAYAVTAAGIGYFLHGWLRVFPRNPIARSFGLSLLALAIAVSCLYNLRAYFVAWPHSPQTLAAIKQHRNLLQ